MKSNNEAPSDDENLNNVSESTYQKLSESLPGIVTGVPPVNLHFPGNNVKVLRAIFYLLGDLLSVSARIFGKILMHFKKIRIMVVYFCRGLKKREKLEENCEEIIEKILQSGTWKTFHRILRKSRSP